MRTSAVLHRAGLLAAAGLLWQTANPGERTPKAVARTTVLYNGEDSSHRVRH